MKHLSAAELSGMLDGVLGGRAIQVVEFHLAECAECRAALADLKAQDQELATTLSHDPGEAYFESFADRVEERLKNDEARGGAMAGLPETPSSGLFGWLSTPRGLALAGGTAAILVGAGVVFLSTRDARMPQVLQDTEMVGRSQQVAPGDDRAAKPVTPSRDETSDLAPVPPPIVQSNEEKTQMRNGAAARNEPRAAVRDETKPEAEASRERAKLKRSAAPERAVRVREGQDGAPVPTQDFRLGRKAASTSPGESRGIVKPPPAPLTGAESTAPKDAATPVSPSSEPTTQEGGTGARSGRRETRLEGSGRGVRIELPFEQGRICGKVVDDRGRGVSGAHVAIAELGATTKSGRDGRFCLDAAAGERTLVVMAVGFEASHRTVEVGAEKPDVEVALRPTAVLDQGGRVSPRMLKLRADADSFAGWSSNARQGARDAQLVTDRATRLRSATEFDRAASEWGRVLDRTKGTDFEVTTRQRIADARFRAWELAPTPQRAAAAVTALTSYIARAPMGPAREEAAKRLDQVRR